MSASHKGSGFEREICKKLSLWWTQDLSPARDDVFWRSSQSGGRATQRMKSGKSTFGSYGDVAFVDPIGSPLLKLFTMELKRGSSHSHPGDLIDFKKENQSHIFAKALLQARRSSIDAGSVGWMMICKRDHRQVMAYIDWKAAGPLHAKTGAFSRPVAVRFDILIKSKEGPKRMRFVAIPFETFLARVVPAQIMACVKNL